MHRYSVGARWYDVLSLERPLYRPARLAAIRMLHLTNGDRVLDVGCGTGLDFAPVRERVGDAGRIVAIDTSAPMLHRARRRISAHAWRNVDVQRVDAATLTDVVGGPFDAALFAYSLSIIDDWHCAWEQAISTLCPGAMVAVIDTAPPCGAWRVFGPMARAFMAAGGVDPSRRVWEVVARDCTDVETVSYRGGHVRVTVGRVPT